MIKSRPNFSGSSGYFFSLIFFFSFDGDAFCWDEIIQDDNISIARYNPIPLPLATWNVPCEGFSQSLQKYKQSGRVQFQIAKTKI